jgi:isocitrate dehydrogenase (NAD+)
MARRQSLSLLGRVIRRDALPSVPCLNESRRSVTYMHRPGDGTPRRVTLIPGDGIGPLVAGAVCQVMEAMHAPVFFDKHDVHGDMTSVPPEVMISVVTCLVD